MFAKILIANRGEIAVRIARSCRELGVATVAVFSDADTAARHVAQADEGVHLPGVVPSDTYLNAHAIIEAAASAGAEAIHPGYGFLAEDADFAEAVGLAGLVWIGPPPAAMRAVGDKISARRSATAAGVPVVPGLLDPIEDPNVLLAFTQEHGYPIAIKASGGGGGRGLKVAHSADEVADALEAARREAEAYFGSSEVFAEKYLTAPKHLEVQILAPAPGHALWLGVRDCSLQRRHQKLVEETPPGLPKETIEEMGRSAASLAASCGYVNAGTVEMLFEDGNFYFLEVNARLQVEHTVTEEVTGLDLVALQLKVAAGEDIGLTQDAIHSTGHSIECRINAEDPGRGFIPAPGRIMAYDEPAGPGVRVDSGYGAGDVVPDAYDSLVAKLVVHASDRESARRRMLRALDDYVIEGITTTIAAHKVLLSTDEFIAGTHTTRTVEDGDALDSLAPAEGTSGDWLLVHGRPVRLWSPSMAASAPAAVHGTGATSDGRLVAPMQGTILKVLVEVGDKVSSGDGVAVLEAMKMETTVAAPFDGVVDEIAVAVGDTAGAGDVIVSISKVE